MKKAKISSAKTKEFDGLISVCQNVLKINTPMNNEERQTGTYVNAQELELSHINNVDKKCNQKLNFRLSKLNQKNEELNKEYETEHIQYYTKLIESIINEDFPLKDAATLLIYDLFDTQDIDDRPDNMDAFLSA